MQRACGCSGSGWRSTKAPPARAMRSVRGGASAAGSSNRRTVDMLFPCGSHAEVLMKLLAVAQLRGGTAGDHSAFLQHQQRVGVGRDLAVVPVDDQRRDAGL